MKRFPTLRPGAFQGATKVARGRRTVSGSGLETRDQAEWFTQPVRGIARPWLDELARRLADVDALGRGERDVVLEAGHTALLRSLHAKLSRLFLIELHALRLTAGEAATAGAGEAVTDKETWSAFIEQASDPGAGGSRPSRGCRWRRRRRSRHGSPRTVHCWRRCWAGHRESCARSVSARATATGAD